MASEQITPIGNMLKKSVDDYYQNQDSENSNGDECNITSNVNISSALNESVPTNNTLSYNSDLICETPLNTQVITVNEVVDDGLLELLKLWELDSHFITFYECGVKYTDLQYLNQTDIGEMFPGRQNVGLRARLRENLFYWKKEQGISMCSTVNDSGVSEWLEKCRDFFKFEPPRNTPKQNPSTISAVLSVREILQSSDMGRKILQNYENNGILDEKSREDIISCIVEYFFDPILKKYKVPDPKMMNKLAQDIVNIFPNESIDIYYIPRNKTRNPSGRLFNRFIRLNRKSKSTIDERNMKKHKSNGIDIIIAPQEIPPNEEDKHDNDEMEILKNKIQLVSEKDNSARDIWARSYHLRTTEILNNTTSLTKILNDWPYFKSSIGDTFIDYDFGIQFQKSKLSLFQEWDRLVCDLRPIFLERLKDKHYKQLYNDIMLNKYDKETANYIHIAALNCILRPTLRHQHKRASIKDAVNTMITHLYAINDLERLKLEKQNQASSSKTTIQPFILIVGPSSTCIKEFYVVLDKVTLKFNSFLSALDICFKSFQIFNLAYPNESELVWQWIQNYIYEIKSDNDKKSSALAEFYLILKNNRNELL